MLGKQWRCPGPAWHTSGSTGCIPLLHRVPPKLAPLTNCPSPAPYPCRCGDGGEQAAQGRRKRAAAVVAACGGCDACNRWLVCPAPCRTIFCLLLLPLQEIFVINDDITVEKPIEDYYGELDKRLQGLKSQLGSDADWMPSTYEKYMTGQHQVAGSLQRNVREYYNDFKLLRADTQVRGGTLAVHK